MGARHAVAALTPLYAGNPAFAAKLPHLATLISAFKPVRGDGDCFPRAVLVRLGEIYCAAGVRASDVPAVPSPLQAHYQALLARAREASGLLCGAFGYNDVTTSDFFDNGLVEYLEALGAPGATPDGAAVLAYMGGLERMRSFNAIFGLRLLGSLEVRTREEHYLPFILGMTESLSAEDFCAACERSATLEVDSIQVMALCDALHVQVRIVCIDAQGPTAAECNVVAIPEAAEAGRPFIELLLRPGHYDIAY